MSRKRTNPFVAAIIGILLVPASVCLHAWNEYRTIHRTRGLQEASEVVKSIPDPDRTESGWDGQLVHLTGDAVTNETLRDPVFAVEEKGITLRRVVEMYQWEEDKDTDDGHTTYSYKKTWHEGRLASEKFERSGHENPQPHYPAWQQTAKTVMVGKYELSKKLKSQKDDEGPVHLDLDVIKQAVGEPDASKLSAREGGLYFSPAGSENSTAEIGDLRIRFALVPNGPVSLIAGLTGNTFKVFKTSNGEPIERLYPGTMSAEEVVDRLRFENTMMAWMLRFAGLVMCLVGTLMIFSPAQAIFRWIPLVGDIAGGMIFFVSALFAISLSLTTISISWIAVRPVLAISLLVVAGAAAYGINRMRRNVNSSPGESDAPDEPIMLTDDMMVS